MTKLQPTQLPAPGTHLVACRGDVLEFSLAVPAKRAGRAWLRTNIGNGKRRRDEIIRHVDDGEPILASDWHDMPMHETETGRFSLSVHLLEVGRFEAKAFFLRGKGGKVPVWPEGGNVVIKVGPAEYSSSNMIYTAFVRQFGPNKTLEVAPERHEDDIRKLEDHGYEVIPRSGTFRQLGGELDFIIGKLGFRILQLLPIHPVPTTYARMGRFGSPFAALDFTDVNPALADFDRKSTPMEQFLELVDAVHARGARIFLDMPINHTGWASHLQIDRPEWFARGPDREFESPGTWDVEWEDASKLDYSHRGLWQHMARVFLFWCRRGADGFRCDAGHMIPCAVWEYIVARVRDEYPDTVFLLEGWGGGAKPEQKLLDKANLDWAYSELFYKVDRSQVEAYLPGAVHLSGARGLLVNFAETHDIPRLAERSPAYARMRTALSALCSVNGGFGITNGVEWFAREKIDVHSASALNWGNEDNQVDLIARLNAILDSHPCFQQGARLRLIHAGDAEAVALLRTATSGKGDVLVLANLKETGPCTVCWREEDYDPGTDQLIDLLSGREVRIKTADELASCLLSPGEVVCLAETDGVDAVERTLSRASDMPARNRRQCLRAMAMDIVRALKGEEELGARDPERDAMELADDPPAFCAGLLDGAPAPVTSWHWPRDASRVVMVPPGYLLLLVSEHPFRAELREGDSTLRHERSMSRDDGTHFAAILPFTDSDEPGRYALALAVHEPQGTVHREAEVLYLSDPDRVAVHTSLSAEDVDERQAYALCTNGRGAMDQVRGSWGEIRDQYDSLLAGNLHPDYPVDRWIMLTRCRAWLTCRGYSRLMDRACQGGFRVGADGSVTWSFVVPAGQGKSVWMDVCLQMWKELNGVTMTFHRHADGDEPDRVADGVPVHVVVRPDIEDRNCHDKTRAHEGPESSWQNAVSVLDDGFVFAPAADRRLEVKASQTDFTLQPEWQYKVPHPVQADRGLDDSSDIFSPAYFTLALDGGEQAVLEAAIVTGTDGGQGPARIATRSARLQRYAQHCGQVAGGLPPSRRAEDLTVSVDGGRHSHGAADLPTRSTIGLTEAARRAMSHFIVRRDELKTVIAGYPWFLDWGRDTLICLRGMIAGGLFEEARQILLQFARFESGGTLPNKIQGGDASDRDTSDAPLWFFVACSDLVRAEGNRSFVDMDADGRTVLDVMKSIARGYMEGAENGIRMDPESGLVFSPAHYTWMDTNHPPGTPREGYPVEIQALWHAALRVLAGLDPGGGWSELADRVRASIAGLFPVDAKEGGWLSDCLHATSGQPARSAVADDALRPNQLLAVTLGAVDEPALCSRILCACEELLVPGAIRSLADRPVAVPLPIESSGQLLNDPDRPYWGQYRGPEETTRKPAYHNGTAWTWVFPSYSEALFMTHGERARRTALAVLSSAADGINRGCVGQVAEIMDGDAPHELRGCGAQAWGATELYRVLALLEGNE